MTIMVMQPVDLDVDQEQQYEAVRQSAGGVFDQPDSWLATPHPMLDAKSPAEMIARGDSDLVVELINSIKSGTFS